MPAAHSRPSQETPTRTRVGFTTPAEDPTPLLPRATLPAGHVVGKQKALTRYCPSWTWSRRSARHWISHCRLHWWPARSRSRRPRGTGSRGRSSRRTCGERHSCASRLLPQPGAPRRPWDSPQPAAQGPLILWAVNRLTGGPWSH